LAAITSFNFHLIMAFLHSDSSRMIP